MTPSIMILVFLGLLVSSPFALVLWVQRESVLRLGEKSRHKARALLGHPVRNRALSADYQRLQLSLINCRQSLNDSIALEKDSTKLLVTLKTALQETEHELSTRPDDDILKRKLTEQRKTTIELEQELQHAQSEKLRDDLTSLESEVQAAYTQEQVLIANDLAAKSIMEGDKVFKGRVEQARMVVERMESKILILEERAYEPRPHAPQQIDDADIELVEKFLSQIASVGSIFASCVDLARISDPSIERAYQRLDKQLQRVRNLAKISLEEELKLEGHISICLEGVQKFQQRADLNRQRGDQHVADQMLQRKSHSEMASVELSEALKLHRRKNFWIGQSLFRIEGTVRRLYVIKLLLCALPHSMKEEFLQYKKLVDAVCVYLKEGWDKESVDQEAPVEFADRIDALERSCIMAYIRIARKDKQLTAQVASRLEQKITKILSALNEEREQQELEFNKWDTLAKQAVQEKKEFVSAVASQRCDQSADILKTTEQCVEVLSLTMLMIEQNHSKKKTSRTPPVGTQG